MNRSDMTHTPASLLGKTYCIPDNTDWFCESCGRQRGDLIFQPETDHPATCSVCGVKLASKVDTHTITTETQWDATETSQNRSHRPYPTIRRRIKDGRKLIQINIRLDPQTAKTFYKLSPAKRGDLIRKAIGSK